ncbi:MAG: NADP-dependent glyceraldehyde-3-phosphate dehydrogenase [Candidatus Nanoarchaeia archaeon]|nr:NADP-dependent glyceraldehyde-3-phosphate dehydrogenase [Candidatus Nanoarchaeia archaeon]MDD5741229.1 NADP-dependent glyceraldehyde-3-phosphate dehydrogenase [Candidatus Nanoarchaeia archaeon]
MATIDNSFFPTENEIPNEYKLKNEIHQKSYLVGGEIKNHDGPMQEVLSPVCIRDNKGEVKQKVIGSYPLMSKEQSLEFLNASDKAYDNGRGYWPTSSVEKRIGHMEKFLKNMIPARENVINSLMWEIGKSYPDSAREFDRTVDYIKDTISALKDLDRISSRPVIEQGIFGQIRRAPLGVTLCMGPYNYPLNETFTTLIPALIMGNTVVVKPAKYGVLLHEPLLKAYQESFPPGVINMIYGEGRQIIGPIMESGKVDALAFIGSSKVANMLEKQHPKPNRLRCVEGLDAKNPAIILNDANLETTVQECITGSLSYNGQRCTALKLLFVQREIADDFISKFSEAVDNLKCGMPWTSNVAITPLPEAGKTKYLDDLVKDAQINGAKIVNPKGGKINYTFFSPTVLYPVNDKMRIFREEQFGPVVPIIAFDDVSEPLKYVEASNYGQQVSIFGEDPKVISKLIDPLVNQVCRVNLNCQCQRGPDTFPFAGRKDSAKGTLSVSDALRVFSIRTLVAAKYNEQNKELLEKILDGDNSEFLSTHFIL